VIIVAKCWFALLVHSLTAFSLRSFRSAKRPDAFCSGLGRGARRVGEVGCAGRAGGLLCGFANIAVRLPVGFLAGAVTVEGGFAAGAAAFGWAAGAGRAG
jgi:hypothetical protein